MGVLSELLREIKAVLFMVVVIIPVLIILPIVILPAFILRGVVNILSKCFRPDLNGLVKREQALFAYKNSSKGALNILLKTVCKGDLNLNTFREDFENRVLTVENNSKLLYEKFRNTWTSFLGYAFWKEDQDFDLKNHIREYDYTGTLGIPPRPDETDVDRILGSLVDAPWNRDRSPWEILIVTNYQLNGDSHSVLLTRVDHALCDGFSLLEIFRRVFQSPLETPKINLGRNPTGPFARLIYFLRLPYDASKNLLQVLSTSKSLRSKISTKEVIISVSPVVDVEMIKKIKNHFKVNFAAVIYSAISGGIQKCIEVSGQKVPQKLTTGFVVPQPNHPGGLCVHTSVVALEWKLKSTLPEERLRKIQDNFESISRSSAPTAYVGLGRLAAYFPMVIRKICIEAFLRMGISVLISSFPATVGPDYYRGHKLVESTGYLGTWSSVGLVIASTGLDNKIRINCSIRKNLFASGDDTAQNLASYVQDELDALLRATV